MPTRLPASLLFTLAASLFALAGCTPIGGGVCCPADDPCAVGGSQGWAPSMDQCAPTGFGGQFTYVVDSRGCAMWRADYPPDRCQVGEEASDLRCCGFVEDECPDERPAGSPCPREGLMCGGGLDDFGDRCVGPELVWTPCSPVRGLTGFQSWCPAEPPPPDRTCCLVEPAGPGGGPPRACVYETGVYDCIGGHWQRLPDPDAGVPDAGPADAGPTDAGPADAGPVDAVDAGSGLSDAGP